MRERCLQMHTFHPSAKGTEIKIGGERGKNIIAFFWKLHTELNEGD